MIAATSEHLRRWNTGAISDAAFRKECWTDSPEALGETAIGGVDYDHHAVNFQIVVADVAIRLAED